VKTAAQTAVAMDATSTAARGDMVAHGQRRHRDPAGYETGRVAAPHAHPPGVTSRVGGEHLIVVDQSLPVILPGQGNQVVDLMESLGPFNISGNQDRGQRRQLMINHAAGTVFSRAFNHFVAGVLTNNPHISTTQAQSPADFIYITQTTTMAGALTSLIGVANYDLAGVVTAIGGGAGRAPCTAFTCSRTMIRSVS
jgi:hypothetical protein